MASDGDVRDNKYYSRCPYCGDSEKHTTRAHLVTHLDSGNFRCYRCGAEGQLSLQSLVELLFTLPPRTRTPPAEYTADDLSGMPDLNQAIVGAPLGGRPSLVIPRYHFLTPDGHVDVFGSRDSLGLLTGYHMRPSWQKAMRTIGKPSLGYVTDMLPPPSREYLRVVEGPYDVTEEQDVCTFGLPTPSQIRLLGFRLLVLCPDGDVMTKPSVATAWWKAFRDANVAWVEILPSGKDPDEVPSHMRLRVLWKDFLALTSTGRSRTSLASAQRALVPRSDASWFVTGGSWR